MLHAIRMLWTLAVIAVVLALAHLVFYGTDMGNRMALHDMLDKHFGAEWANYIDYATTSKNGALEATISVLAGRDNNDAPESWNPRAIDWWNENKTKETPLVLTIQYGRVFYGPAVGEPATKFGPGPFTAPQGLLVLAAGFAVLCILIAYILGRVVDAESKSKQFNRPGSALNRPSSSSTGSGPSSRPGDSTGSGGHRPTRTYDPPGRPKKP